MDNNVLSTVIANKEFFGILVSLLTVLIPFATFIVSKNKEQEQKNVENFHEFLMRGLSNQDGKKGLDQQVAIIFELRRYPEYSPVIVRLLKAATSRWKSEVKSKPHFHQLISEAEATIDYFSKNKLQKLFYRN